MFIIDGESESWTEWSYCQTPCPWTWCKNTICIGAQTRNRSCVPHLSNNATIKCTGAISERQFCLIAGCPVKEIWSDWTEWSACSVTCGSGYRQRVRFCADRKNSCHGDLFERELCGSGITCERLDELSIWGEWSACSQSCGGNRTRRRICTDLGDKNCSGSLEQSQICHEHFCEGTQILSFLSKHYVSIVVMKSNTEYTCRNLILLF